MSIEIDWDALTTGPAGAELAESIRVFIHDKFQEVNLPKFIRSVEVHAFEFGESCPSIVIKDICDPLSDFYEDEDCSENVNPGEQSSFATQNSAGLEPQPAATRAAPSLLDRRIGDQKHGANPRDVGTSVRHHQFPNPLNVVLPRPQSTLSLADQLASPGLSRSSTPRIPGGTSNLSYFHIPLANRLQGTGAQSPLSAVAGWQEHQAHLHAVRMTTTDANSERPSRLEQHRRPSAASTQASLNEPDPSTRPSTAHSQRDGNDAHGFNDVSDHPSQRTPSPQPEANANDLQIVLHISYSGNIRLSLTAEILLDYPMPSFVSIPVKLNITGLSFDGVALLALLDSNKGKGSNGSGDTGDGDGDRRAHFCFLGPEDAEMLVGAENVLSADESDAIAGGAHGLPWAGRRGSAQTEDEGLGSLLRKIRVESEIGKTKDGRQNLKNVGKVERFVLEQVRQIFDDEFVYPSFWTFLV